MRDYKKEILKSAPGVDFTKEADIANFIYDHRNIHFETLDYLSTLSIVVENESLVKNALTKEEYLQFLCHRFDFSESYLSDKYFGDDSQTTFLNLCAKETNANGNDLVLATLMKLGKGDNSLLFSNNVIHISFYLFTYVAFCLNSVDLVNKDKYLEFTSKYSLDEVNKWAKEFINLDFTNSKEVFTYVEAVDYYSMYVDYKDLGNDKLGLSKSFALFLRSLYYSRIKKSSLLIDDITKANPKDHLKVIDDLLENFDEDGRIAYALHGYHDNYKKVREYLVNIKIRDSEKEKKDLKYLEKARGNDQKVEAYNRFNSTMYQDEIIYLFIEKYNKFEDFSKLMNKLYGLFMLSKNSFKADISDKRMITMVKNGTYTTLDMYNQITHYFNNEITVEKLFHNLRVFIYAEMLIVYRGIFK